MGRASLLPARSELFPAAISPAPRSRAHAAVPRGIRADPDVARHRDSLDGVRGSHRSLRADAQALYGGGGEGNPRRRHPAPIRTRLIQAGPGARVPKVLDEDWLPHPVDGPRGWYL